MLGSGTSLIFYTDGLLDAYASTVGAENTLGIDEFVTAVDQCAGGSGAVSSWIPSLVTGAPRASVDDTAVVVVTLHAPAGQ
jgi:hypothetical protein